MRQLMMTVIALTAFGALVVTAQAENQTARPSTVSRPVTIYARVNGYVAILIADIGDRVKKDQVLATIATPELDAQVDAALAQLKASEAEVKVKEADVDFAQLYAARARVALDQAKLDSLFFLMSYKQVTAPFEGVITDRRVDIGDRVTSGSTKDNTPLYEIAPIGAGGAAGGVHGESDPARR